MAWFKLNQNNLNADFFRHDKCLRIICGIQGNVHTSGSNNKRSIHWAHVHDKYFIREKDIISGFFPHTQGVKGLAN